MPDWNATTSAWVAEGLVADDKRAALLERLVEIESKRAVLPLGPIVTLLVSGAVWLLTGALVTLLVLLGQDDETLNGGIVAAVGFGVAVLGGVMRPVQKLLPLARGFLAASPPLLVLGTMPLFDDAPLALFVLVPGLVGMIGAVVEGSRATATTASLSTGAAALWVVEAMPSQSEKPAATVAFLVAGLAVAALSLGSRGFQRYTPARVQVLQVMVPAVLLFAAIDVWMTGTHFPSLWNLAGRPRWWVFGLEKWVELLLFGAAACAAGTVSRSGFTLVPSLAMVAVATIGIAGAVGSYIGATIALTLVGGTFLAGAAVLWVLQSRRS